MKRLPIYFLIDTSGSMSGIKIKSVNEGLSTLLYMLMNSAETMRCAYISAIEFNDSAKVIMPTTYISKINDKGERTFIPPKFGDENNQTYGRTSFVSALKKLKECLETDIIRRNKDNQETADYKPILIVLTDGKPTDSAYQLNETIEEFKKIQKKFFSIICCYVLGTDSQEDEVNAMNLLKEIAGYNNGDGNGIVIEIEEDSNQITEFFKYVSQTIINSFVEDFTYQKMKIIEENLVKKFNSIDFDSIDFESISFK